MKILILGAGAVGTFAGGKLSAAGHQVSLLNHNDAYCRAVNERGCFIVENGKTFPATAKAFPSLTEVFEKNDRFELAILAVKGFATERLMNELKPYSEKIRRFLALQNGIGNEEILFRFVEADRITAGSLTIACSMETPGTAVAENEGGIALAAIPGDRPDLRAPDRDIIELFETAGFRVRACSDWRAMKWSKLLLNVIANATCAILDMTAAEIFSDDIAFRLDLQACREVLAVMEALGLKPQALPSQPVPLYAWGIEHLPSKLLQIAFGKKAGKGRGRKLSSLHLDLRSGKNRTESPFLYGAPALAGKEKKISCPALETLNALIESGAKNPAALEKFRKNPRALLDAVQGAAGGA